MTQSKTSRGSASSNDQREKLASESLKAGGKTYFFDIKEAKSGKPYLAVTEVRFDKSSGQRERSSLIFYPEGIREFHKIFQSMARQLLKFDEELESRPRQQSFDDEL